MGEYREHVRKTGNAHDGHEKRDRVRPRTSRNVYIFVRYIQMYLYTDRIEYSNVVYFIYIKCNLL